MSKLVGVCWLITSRCNMDCPVCCRFEEKGSLSLEEKYKIVDKVVASSITKLNIAGGEPLLDDDLLDVIVYAKKKGLKVALSSNGLLITEEIFKKLNNYIDELQLPLDGPNKEIHSSIRNSSNHFDIVIEKINMMKQRKFQLDISTVVTKQNYKYLSKQAELINTLNVDKWKLFHFVPVSYGRENKEKYLLDYDEFVGTVSKIKNIPLKVDFDYGIANQERLDSYFNITPLGNFYLTKGQHFEVYGNVLECDNLNKMAAKSGFNFDFHDNRFWRDKG